jgi:4-coumarate--CoA ligase
MTDSPRIYRSKYPSINSPIDQSISQFLCDNNPDDCPASKIIFSDFDNADRTLTFGSIRDDAATGAAALKDKLGLQPEDVICIYGKNSVNWALLAHSSLWAGGCIW